MSKPGPDARTAEGHPRDAADVPGVEPGVVVSTTSLLNGRREVVILHGGERYRLRVTANDKLILTK